MVYVSGNWESILIVILVIAFPSIFTRVNNFLVARRTARQQAPPIHHTQAHGAQNAPASGQEQPPPPPPRSTLQTYLLIFASLHALYTIYILTFDAPFNIFTSLDIPLSTPIPQLRAILSSGYPSEVLPPDMELLMTRLQSFDALMLYVRFGHSTIAECTWCHSFNDFALFLFPKIAIQYVVAVAVVGCMTMQGSGKKRWRNWSVMGLLAMAAAEVWILANAEIKMPRPRQRPTMIHDLLFYVRQCVFAIVPFVLYLLPDRPHPFKPLGNIPIAAQSLEAMFMHLRMLEVTRIVGLRNPELREAMLEGREKEHLEGERVRNDPEIWREATRLGLGATAPAGEAPEDVLRTWQGKARARVAGFMEILQGMGNRPAA